MKSSVSYFEIEQCLLILILVCGVRSWKYAQRIYQNQNAHFQIIEVILTGRSKLF